MNDATARDEIGIIAARITARPRDYLEKVEEAARAYIFARDNCNAPSDWAAAEDALRRALGAGNAKVGR